MIVIIYPSEVQESVSVDDVIEPNININQTEENYQEEIHVDEKINLDQTDQISDELQFYQLSEASIQQRKFTRNAAILAIENDDPMPPEMRLGKFSSFRSIMIEFTNEMNFPDTD